MLNIFWQFLAFSMIGATILRLAVATSLLILGYKTFKAAKTLKKHTGGQTFPKVIGTIEFISGLFILIGLWTQVFALIASVTAIILFLIRRHYAATAIESRQFYLLLSLASLSILFFGAGIFAIDVPI